METASFESTIQVAEVELVYKSKVRPSERPQILTSRHAYTLLLETWNRHKIELLEEFKVMFLNNKSRVLGILTASSGGLDRTIIDLRIVFAAALKIRASSIIISHNHPSGVISPSKEDQRVTEKFRQAGQILDIIVADHLIISPQGYYSFADQGAL